MKRIVVAIFLVALMMAGAQKITYAGNFSLLASTGVLHLSNNQAWEKSYKTDKGKLKVRFRKLWTASDKKKYHLIVWWNDVRIADGYCPKIAGGYSFDILRDDRTNRVFILLRTMRRLVLLGYEPENGRLEKYIDSNGTPFYNTASNPQLKIDADRDLILQFTSNNKSGASQYKLFWNDSTNWFGYRDVTVRNFPAYDEPYIVNSGNEDMDWDGVDDAGSAVQDFEELYYEEAVVVGS